MRSVMQHSFSQVPRAEIQRSQFNRSHGYKTTFDAGYLVPVFVDEALPGDTFNVRMSAFARLATPLKPLMDNLFLDSFFFAVPNRLVWDNWQRFCGEQTDPDDPTDYTIPQMVSPVSTGYVVGTLSDYFGLPTDIAGVTHSALWHRAYNLIYNEWFRDQNLQDSVVVDRDDAASDPADYVLLRRGKRPDYFASCLPWPQKGDSVELPLGSTAPVDFPTATGTFYGSTLEKAVSPFTSYGNIGYQGVTDVDRLIGTTHVGEDANARIPVVVTWPTNAETDLSGATAATINQLRQAFQIQRLYERDARGGTRYTEIVQAHFNVVSPDARLQRPEYLGGGSTPVVISPIAQTSATDDTVTPQGNLAAMGTVAVHGHGFTKSFTEHCLVIGLVCVRADLTYQQGLMRQWSRLTRWDFYWPALAHIGEQAVLNKEIYCKADANDDLVFGYQERFAEYRYKSSQITGKFRSTYAQSLDIWHLSQEFTVLPTLGSDFIVENPPIDRVIAVTDEPHFLFDSYFDFKCARPMPVFGVPGLIDHF